MSPAEFLLDETRQWLRRAAQDLEVARLSLQADIPGICAFHAQQAVEKSMKAFLTWHQQPFGKTHNLGVLIAPCTAIDASLESILETARNLSQYAVASRYPGIPDPTREDAESALLIAKSVYDAILSRLPVELRT